MAVQGFFDNFAVLADAPNGVAKLRQLIIQLAVEGKLVPQYQNDEPAKLLFDRISNERDQHFKEKKTQTTRPLPPAGISDLNFDLPIGWHVTRFGQVFDLVYGKNLPDKARNSRGQIPVYGSNGIVGFHDEALVNEPSLVVGRKGSIGAVNLASEPCFPIDTTYYITPPKGVDLLFSYFLVKSLKLGRLDKATAIPGLNRQDAYLEPIALPPFEEQKRIVAKIDELMRLCDELEAQQQARRESRMRLSNATLAPLNNAASLTPKEFEQATTRLAENFATLYDCAETVAKLRSTILQLAVQGKLVPQDSSDDPARVLLERVSKEKKRLIKEGKLNNKNPLPEIKTDEQVFKLPEKWVWARMGDIVDYRLGKMLDKAKNKGKPYPYLRNTNVQWLRFDLSDVKEMRFEESELDEYEVRRGDLLVCEGGEPGRCAIWDGQIKQVMFQKAIHRVRPFADINSWFLLYRLLADAITGNLEKHFTGATIRHFTGQELAKYVLGLPPLNEQKRIVAKVNQLMALCDGLETKLRQADVDSEKLMNAAVQHVLGKEKSQRESALALAPR